MNVIFRPDKDVGGDDDVFCIKRKPPIELTTAATYQIWAKFRDREISDSQRTLPHVASSFHGRSAPKLLC